MEEIDNNEKILNILKDTFDNVNNWLVFAETKLGALIGVTMIFLIKVTELLITTEEIQYSRDIFLILSIICFLIVVIIALSAFFPKLSDIKENFNCVENNTSHRVLIFYSDISEYCNSQNYLRDVYIYYLGVLNISINFPKIHLDFAKEIWINSKIAAQKYMKFKLAIIINIIAIVLFLTYIILTVI